jgi:hypothetical protein
MLEFTVRTRTLVEGTHAPIVAENMTPEEIPADWLIFNAPRPLYGDRTWIGPFCSGVFYAAVDPSGDGTAAYIKMDRELDAVLIRWVTEAEIREWADTYYREEWPQQYPRLKDKIQEIEILDLLDTYRDHTPDHEIVTVEA